MDPDPAVAMSIVADANVAPVPLTVTPVVLVDRLAGVIVGWNPVWFELAYDKFESREWSVVPPGPDAPTAVQVSVAVQWCRPMGAVVLKKTSPVAGLQVAGRSAPQTILLAVWLVTPVWAMAAMAARNTVMVAAVSVLFIVSLNT